MNQKKVSSLKKIIGVILAILLILSAFGHFFSPEMYFPLIPEYLPKTVINILVGIVEIVLGVGVFIPGARDKALFGIFLLMLVFLPIHIWDACKEAPAMGSRTAAFIRIGFQFILIFLPWYARGKNK